MNSVHSLDEELDRSCRQQLELDEREGSERDVFEISPSHHACQGPSHEERNRMWQHSECLADVGSMDGKRALSACLGLVATAIACAAVGKPFIAGIGTSVLPNNIRAPTRRGRIHFFNRMHIFDPDNYTSIDQIDIFDPLKYTSIDQVDTPAPAPPILPLSKLVKRKKIRGDVSWMMDFAILGFPKCGTTFLMHWLEKSNETYLNNGEVCKLDRNQPGDLVSMYYSKVVSDDKVKHVLAGLKCPKGLETKYGLKNWARYFPKTNFIVTVRHPVLHFQSFYNYRAYFTYPKEFPSPNDLIGACEENSNYICGEKCDPDVYDICTDRSKFHHALSRLGKTRMLAQEERNLLHDRKMKISPVPGKVFLMEISQLYPENPASEHLPEDLRDFLRLEHDLQALKTREKTGKKSHEYSDPDRRSAFINICDAEYAPVRDVLVEIGKEASHWIRDYFLKSPDVVVSSPELFLGLLEQWGKDPCAGKESV